MEPLCGWARLRQRSSQLDPVARLAIAAGLSALIYLLVFVRSLNLIELRDQPLHDLLQVSKSDPLIAWKVSVAFIALGILYWLAYRAARQAHGRKAWLVVIVGALVLSGLMVFVFPYDATDAFDNIMRGRITGVYGFNPFQDIPDRFSTDPFYPYTAWKHTTSIYGPAWEVLASLVARFVGNEIVVNVVVYKLALGAFLAGSVGLVAAILRRIAPERALAGVVFLAWNPLVLHEAMGNGHNDIAMMFWVLLGIWWLLDQRYTLALLALVMGALFKYVPLMLLPAAGVIALRDLATTRKRVRFTVLTVVGASALIGLAYLPFWYGIDTLNLRLRSILFTSSLPAALSIGLQPTLSAEAARQLVNWAAGSLTVIFVVWQALRARSDRSPLGFTRSVFYSLMFYLMFTSTWFQHWYVVWPLAVAALLPFDRSFRLANVFGVAAWARYFIAGPIVFWVLQLPATNELQIWFGPLGMAMPWAYTGYALWRARQH